MGRPFLRLNASTRGDRHVHFELPRAQTEALRQALAATELSLDAESLEALARLAPQGSAAAQDLSGTLQLTFVHDGPDLRHPVPAVPG